MALQHAQPLDIIDVRPMRPAAGGPVTHSLLKTGQLQLMRVVLLSGEHMPEHHVQGEISIQCIEGDAVVATPSRECRLRAGELVVLPGNEPHSLRALQDSSLLVTVLLLR